MKFTTWAYGDSLVKGGILPEVLHIIFFLLALPRFSSLFFPNLGGQLPPCPPAPLPRTPMVHYKYKDSGLTRKTRIRLIIKLANIYSIFIMTCQKKLKLSLKTCHCIKLNILQLHSQGNNQESNMDFNNYASFNYWPKLIESISQLNGVAHQMKFFSDTGVRFATFR